MKATLGRVLAEALDGRLADLHVALPARVERYDPATQLADCQPLIKRPVQGEDAEVVETLPVIPNVPVAWPRAGNWFLSLPLSKGDTVLVVFCERSLDQWLERGGIVDPGDLRTHSLDGAVAYAGLYPRKEALADVHAENIVLGQDGGVQIHIRPDGTIALGADSPGDWVARASLADGDIGSLKSFLDTLKIWLDAHVHPTSMGPSGPPAAPSGAVPTMGGTASATVRTA
jgi:hypothetical protein